MRITSSAFVGTVMALAVLAVVAVPVLWDSFGRNLMVRAISVLTATTLTVLSALLVVNAQGDFYPTYDSLFSSDASGLTVGQSGVQADLGRAPTQTAIDAVGHHRDGNHGVVVRMELRGARTQITRRAAVYLPAAYFDPALRNFRFPVIEMLHGSPGNPDGVLRYMGAKHYLDRAISVGDLPPVVAVIPTTNSATLHDNECVNAVGGTQDDTYLTADIRDRILSTFRVRQDRAGWAMLGYSTGGYCAVNLTLRHPQWYSAAVSLSGPLTPTVDATTGNLFRGSSAARFANDPLFTVTRQHKWPLAFYLYVGAHEKPDVGQALRFARAAQLPLSVTLAVDGRRRGGHNFIAWRYALPQALAWLGGQLGGLQPMAPVTRSGITVTNSVAPAKSAGRSRSAAQG